MAGREGGRAGGAEGKAAGLGAGLDAETSGGATVSLQSAARPPALDGSAGSRRSLFLMSLART